MKLTPKGQATKQRIVEGAAAHLRSTDPLGVTLDDIRATTGTSKGQLFHYFPDGKEELFLEVARFEADRVLADQQPYLGRLDSWTAWDQWCKAVVARYREQGRECPLAALMAQVGSTPGASEVSTTLLRHWQGHVERGILAMQAQGQVSERVDARRMAGAFITGIQGGVSTLRVTGRTEHLESMLEILVEHLRTA